MSEWFWFVLKFPLIVFLILFIGAVFSDPSLLKVLIGIFFWPFSTAPEEELLIKRTSLRLLTAFLCWIGVATALFAWLKWGPYEKSFWTDIMGVENVNKIKHSSNIRIF